MINFLVITAALVLTGFLFRRACGPKIWPVVLFFLPLAGALVWAEIQASKGVLAVIVQSTTAAPLFAFILAVALLYSGHKLAGVIKHQLETNPANEIYHPGVQFNKQFEAVLLFGICTGAYIYLGILRGKLLADLLGVHIMDSAGFFFLYPVFSLILATFAYPFIEEIADHIRRYYRTEQDVALARQRLEGYPNRVLVRNRINTLRISGMSGQDPDEYIQALDNRLENLGGYVDFTNDNLELPTDWQAVAEDERVG